MERGRGVAGRSTAGRHDRSGRGIHLRGITGHDDRERLADQLSGQCRQALLNASRSLGCAGLSMSDVIRVVYLLRNADAFPSCFPLLRDAFGEARPAATLRLVDGFDAPGIEIELELFARQRPIAA
ncbi:MAG: hypothetical protein INR65_09855 [Gluconacetobacter diazotrophicus]|nr:hypothetical protein [Gluconacetobacter diazotrophicus]